MLEIVGNLDLADTSLVTDFSNRAVTVRWKLKLAETGLAESFVLKDTFQKMWSTIFDF